MDQPIRNKLRGVVTQCRKLLEDSTAQALQGRFGIYAARKKGEVQVEDEARMAHLTEEDRACRQDLLDHLEHIQAIGYKPSEALEQLVREIAFTHLNRLCAYKMMESRGLIREAVSRGLKSQGFFFYLSDHPEDEKLHNGGGQETAYRNFLDWLGGTLSQEIGVLFNPNDPANRIYPPQRVLDEVLSLINDRELKDIWSQDETIGWVYQYFTPKELRDKARKESQAPRNSYELAFRNQFFTPRYVVEFLTDNTLGRIWHEMTQGETGLKNSCRYLVRRPTEIFLKPGEAVPVQVAGNENLSQEELRKQPVHIPHRPMKDPRTLRMLDPACGSMHFGLYSFDLYERIYDEAWELELRLGGAAFVREAGLKPLVESYTDKEAFLGDVPRLIIEHNIHGIDIDPRAVQIAGLSLWLRAQRSWHKQGVKPADRPRITRSNIVCAEPMPGETDLLKEFTATLQPKVLGQLVEVVFEKMKLAGEAGSLLKIEEEIREAALTAKKEYQEELRRRKEQAGYLPGIAPPVERTLFDFSDMTDSEFLDRAEEEIVAALRHYAEKASNGRGFRRRLFAEDAARGFAFIDLCRKRYDTVLMNPPFGAGALRAAEIVEEQYPECRNDVYGAFILRAYSILSNHGSLGAITNRTGFFTAGYENWRSKIIYSALSSIRVFADLGSGVLDSALVETAAYCCDRAPRASADAFSLIGFDDKGAALLNVIQNAVAGTIWNNLYTVEFRSLSSIPAKPFAYWAPPEVVRLFNTDVRLEPAILEARQGLRTLDDFRFLRLWWELPQTSTFNKSWVYHLKGGQFQRFFGPPHLLCKWKDLGAEIKALVKARYGSVTRIVQAQDYYFRFGLTYTRRTSSRLSVRVAPAGCNFADRGPLIVSPADSISDLYFLLGILNSPLYAYLISLSLAAAEGAARSYEVGIIQRLPLLTCSEEDRSAILEQSKHVVRSIQSEDRKEINSSAFVWQEKSDVKLSDAARERESSLAIVLEDIEAAVAEIDDLVLRAAGADAFSSVLSEYRDFGRHSYSATEDADEEEGTSNGYVPSVLLSETVRMKLDVFLGATFGRWDIRFATGERQPPELPDPFDPLPVCPPGMLQGPDGLPAKPEDVPSNYPIRIDWDGILVDDPEHEEDIVRSVRDVLEVIWKERAEAIEREACEILGVRELRDYFRKPGNGGFWMDHVKRYSKSRRKSPIYWYLRSVKGNYGIWLYYHRLDKDILFKVLLNYVEPKIRLEEDRLKALRGRKEATGSSGREAKQIEKDMDRQEQFVSELHDFADKLRRAANLHLEPDLNDGVVLNIAPLWELAPWKEAKGYWEALQEGKYDWSHIAYQLWPERVKELCKKDRSIAIAHGLEHLCEVEPAKIKRSIIPKEADSEEVLEDET